MKRSRNLWLVRYTLGWEKIYGGLFILAGTASGAERKAVSFLKKQRRKKKDFRRIVVTSVEHQGEIDVF